MATRDWFRNIFKTASKKQSARRRQKGRISLRYELLEGRAMMACLGADLTDGVLTYTFDGDNDTAFVRQSGAGNTFISATANGGPIAGTLFPTANVTSIVVIAGAGNDTINASGVLATTPLTLIGGAGDDILTGSGGADLIYGDDVPTQTFSPADPFTTAGNSSSNGFGAPWVNIQPGSLFNQRQVARFNSAGTGTASVGSGAWTAFLPRFVPGGSSSASVLTYRQDNSYSTIDLSGIASVSFDINVTGSVSGFWYLMDPNGYIAEVPAGFALSAGTHTVTLDLSMAAIDAGFDLSAVREMRIWISAASANSSVSVSNLRNGVIPATLGTADADPLTTAQAGGNPGTAPWLPIPDALFAERQAKRANNATASVGLGAWTMGPNQFSLPTSNGQAELSYRQGDWMDVADGVNAIPSFLKIDLSDVKSISFDITVTGSLQLNWYMEDEMYNSLSPTGSVITLAAGTSTQTFDFSTASLDTGAFDFSAVTGMTINLSGISAGEGATVTNIKYTYGAPETGGNDTIDGRGGSDYLFGQGGNDTFHISNARDAFGDRINGGSGLDTVKNVTTAETVVLTDFRTTGNLDTQTVFGVEQFDGNGKSEIRGRDAAFDGLGNDVDALDFTGIDFIGGVTTINLRSGNDQYIGGNTALTVNGGSGNDTMSAGVGGGKLNGDAGTDTLTGGTAATTLNGGADADFLFAGSGATTFAFNILETNNAQDQVSGFRQGIDFIKLNWSVYVGASLTPTVLGGQSGPSGTGPASQIRYGNDGTDTTIYLPGTGGNAFRRIKLLGFTGSLSLGDFILS